MGKRQKRRKRKRAQERGEEKQQEHLANLTDNNNDEDDESEDETSSGLFSLFRQSKDEPVYEDKPWWSQEEDYELSEYERKQYGAYKKMPPPMKPEHLREPEDRKQKADDTGESAVGQVAAVATQEVSKVVERVKRIDWELVWVRVLEIRDKLRDGFKHVVDEIQFRNLQMKEKVPPKFHIPIYVGIALVLLGIPLTVIILLLARHGGGTSENVANLTPVPQANVITVQPTATPVPEIIVPTNPPPTNRPPTAFPTNTPLPPTAVPTSPPVVQPTLAPTREPVAAAGSIAPFFAPPVQSWSGDIVRWSQTYGVDVDFMTIVMQLETCGNPVHLGDEGRMGLFAVPAERFQGDESFINPEDNARRAVELMQVCLSVTGNDIGQAYTCYRSNTDTTQVESGQWPAEMQRYFLWSFGIYSDIQMGAQSSAALNDWLVNGAGFDMCNQAQAALNGQ